MKRGALLLAACAVLAAPTAARAFCGFYIEGSGKELYNNATQVVLMREGTRTVLSMQNNYQGPPEDFALVIPVPVVLQEENVKTLPRDVFEHIDKLDAPRLVEYWEADPCAIDEPMADMAATGMPMPSAPPPKSRASENLGVTIEAQFAVGEYQIVILSATDSTGLDTWLKQEGYKMPPGAEPYLRPYVEGGSKFFVAKIDVKKVSFENGMATLSPLRFHYDTDEFSLPIRLGMVNAKDSQDLIVHILSRGERYEVANYPNAFIPTNIDVRDSTRDKFAEFYAALYDKTVEANPGAVITEYSWDAGTCDPCPTPALTFSELATLGADVIDAIGQPGPSPGPPASGRMAPPMPPRMPPMQARFVLTRLHARYDKGGLKDDLVFRKAAAVMGGREVRSGPNGSLEEGARPSGVNNFQGRYAIRHEWTGPIECANPRRGMWGGPPSGGAPPLRPALDTAFAKRDASLTAMIAQDIPELKLIAAAPMQPNGTGTTPPANAADPGQTKKKKSGCGCSGTGPSEHGGTAALFLIAAVMMRRRRRSVP
jgi:MYXO-CTERM domain-containing protein